MGNGWHDIGAEIVPPRVQEKRLGSIHLCIIVPSVSRVVSLRAKKE